jgi:hypothetical protein
MNVYMIRDGGDDRCWKAETMAKALKASEDAYITENRVELKLSEYEERQHYQTEMLESCTLVGELANPWPDQ